MHRSGTFWLIVGVILAVGCGPAISTSLQQEAGPRAVSENWRPTRTVTRGGWKF